MISQWMVILGAFLVSAVLSSFFASRLANFRAFCTRDFYATASLITGCLLTCIFVLPFFWDTYDFVSNLGIWAFLAPMVGLLVIYATGFIPIRFVTEAAVLLASVIGVFGGNLYIEFFAQYSAFVNKLCTILVWFLFSIGIRAVASLYPVLHIQTVTISAGFVLLYIFGVIPFALGCVAAAFLGAACVSYLNYRSQVLSVGVSPIIGYFIGWFGLISYNEMLFSCYIVLVLFCLMEMTVSLLKKRTFLKKYEDFSTNSFLVQVYKAGLPAAIIIKSLWMLSGVVVIFAVLQANGVNDYSIPVFVAFLMLWQFYRMIDWKEDIKTWKEKRQDIVSNVKQTIENVKKQTKTGKTKSDKKGQKKCK